MTTLLHTLGTHYDNNLGDAPMEPSAIQSGMHRVPKAFVDGVGRPQQKRKMHHMNMNCMYAFPSASPGSSALPDEPKRQQNVAPHEQEWSTQNDSGVAFELMRSIDQPQPGSEDLEHLAPSPPVLCSHNYTVWESYQPNYVGRPGAAGPMYQRSRPPFLKPAWTLRCNEDVRPGAALVPAEHTRLRHLPTTYSTPDEWIPRGAARARPNPPPGRMDRGEDTSVVHPNFLLWRNTDANLECGALGDEMVAALAAKGWTQSADAEGKTTWVQKATGRVSYRPGGLLRSPA